MAKYIQNPDGTITLVHRTKCGCDPVVDAQQSLTAEPAPDTLVATDPALTQVVDTATVKTKAGK